MNAVELKDYYGLLGVPRSATFSEIHRAYWRQASRCHPDRGGSHDSMVQVVEAWKILSDPNRRSRYDQLLKYRGDGWHSRKFDADVQDARKGAEESSACSWAEFEETYQKAFYMFNQDFYGEDLNGNAAGPYSPLLGSKSKGLRNEGIWKSKPAVSGSSSRGGSMIAYIVKTLILFAAIVAAFFAYRNYSGVGRYVPLGQQGAAYLLILDTTNGSVYSVEKQNGIFTSRWKEIVSPFPREKQWPRK